MSTKIYLIEIDNPHARHTVRFKEAWPFIEEVKRLLINGTAFRAIMPANDIEEKEVVFDQIDRFAHQYELSDGTKNEAEEMRKGAIEGAVGGAAGYGTAAAFAQVAEFGYGELKEMGVQLDPVLEDGVSAAVNNLMDLWNYFLPGAIIATSAYKAIRMYRSARAHNKRAKENPVLIINMQEKPKSADIGEPETVPA